MFPLLWFLTLGLCHGTSFLPANFLIATEPVSKWRVRKTSQIYTLQTLNDLSAMLCFMTHFLGVFGIFQKTRHHTWYHSSNCLRFHGVNTDATGARKGLSLPSFDPGVKLEGAGTLVRLLAIALQTRFKWSITNSELRRFSYRSKRARLILHCAGWCEGPRGLANLGFVGCLTVMSLRLQLKF